MKEACGFILWCIVLFFREREKAEIRDRKVLEVLQRKDDRISELQANLAYKARELGETTVRWVIVR